MSKSKKKRSKQYNGRDAAGVQKIHRYTAIAKNPVREWWEGHKKVVKIISIAAFAVFGFGWLIFEFLRMIF